MFGLHFFNQKINDISLDNPFLSCIMGHSLELYGRLWHETQRDQFDSA